MAMILISHRARAAAYISPDDSTELIQLEKIPLQIHQMRELSDHLVVIARRTHDASPANQQATGRLLLLATQLDPTNSKALSTNKALAAGNVPAPPQAQVLDASIASLQKLLTWLASPKAGPEANKLANYLADATKTLRQETSGNRDLGDWQNTVPPLSKYTAPKPNPDAQAGKDKEPKAKAPLDDADKKAGDGNTPGQDNHPTPAKGSADFHLREQAVFAPFALRSEAKDNGIILEPDEMKDITSNVIAPVQLKLKPTDSKAGGAGFYIKLKIDHSGGGSLSEAIEKKLKNLLINRHPNLPGFDGKVEITGGRYETSNRLNLAAPLALMLEASLSNTPLRDDIHVFAAVNEEGKLIQPANPWEMLSTLRRSPGGGRLIASPETTALLTQVLVYREPEFFTRWEVISAEDIDQAVAAAIRKSAPDLSKASKLFQSVQSLTRRSDVSQLAANHSVRNRLEEILVLAPNHLSAKILLLQGSGKRPMYLNEQGLAYELLPLVRTLSHVLDNNAAQSKLDADILAQHHEHAREKIDPLDRITERKNDSLYLDTLKLANDFRSLALLIERNLSERGTEYSRKKAQTMVIEMKEFGNKLLARTVATTSPGPAKKTDQ